MIDPRLLRLHIEISSTPQLKMLTPEDMDYFWYSIASCIVVHRPEWANAGMLEHIAKVESQ